MNARVKEKYLISRLELLDHDSLAVPPFWSFLLQLGTVVSLLTPFLQFGNLNFPCGFDRLEVHVPLLDSPTYSTTTNFNFYS
jgi:hypothetical protein